MPVLASLSLTSTARRHPQLSTEPMSTQSPFQVLSPAPARRVPCGALLTMFRICREIAEGINADVRAGRFSSGVCAHCSRFRHPVYGDPAAEIQSLLNDYPLELVSPFEGVESISGGVWKASELISGEDALLHLRFGSGTRNLPMHSHDHSDRVIFVAGGRGVFRYATKGSSSPSMRSIEVAAGHLLVFTRGTVHTFKTEDSELHLLSYHTPYIALSDPRQYRVWDPYAAASIAPQRSDGPSA